MIPEMKKQALIIVLLGGWMAGRVWAAPPSTHRPRAQQAALWITDIHLNPYTVPGLVTRLQHAPLRRWRALWLAALRHSPRPAGAKNSYGAYGMDSNALLLDSALAAMRKAAARQGRPAFIVITGDLLAHGFHHHFLAATPQHTQADYDAFVQRMFRYVIARLRASFPGVPLLPALGNNDSDCGDYQPRPGAPFMSGLAAAWSGLLASRHADRQFAADGYYSVRLPLAGGAHPVRAIVLNDIDWSPHYHNGCGTPRDAQAGAEQMRWLRATLYASALRDERVWVMAHIPPGADVFSSLNHTGNACARPPVMFLAASYNRELVTLLRQYAAIVRLGLFGHTHQDEFRLAGAVPLKIAPSLSPIFGNNPSFTLLRLGGGRVKDYRVYRMNLAASHPRWRLEYDFDRSYAVNSPADLPALAPRLAADAALRRRFQGFYNAGSLAPNFSRLAWPDFRCGISHLNAASFQRCACPATPKRLPRPSPTKSSFSHSHARTQF